jgi:predicted RNA binding protein YcfA (HicA-like mRNA interferase family)
VRPVSWQELVQLCKSEKSVFDREKGDHYIMTRPGLRRPVVIPKKRDLKEDIVLSVSRTLGLNRKEIEARPAPKKTKVKPN